MFHINDKNEAKPCRAKTPDKCRFYKNEDNPRHYTDLNEAIKASEELFKKDNGGSSLSTKQSKYSFVREFAKQVEEFDKEYEGFPNRFFNADLAGNIFSEAGYKEYMNNLGSEKQTSLYWVVKDPRKLAQRLTYAASTPNDLNNDSELNLKRLKNLGMTDVKELGVYSSRSLGVSKAWYGKFDGQQVVVTDKKQSSNFGRYHFRNMGIANIENEFDARNFLVIDSRALAGAERLNRLTNNNVFAAIKDTVNTNELREPMMYFYKAVENKQQEGSNFKAQQKFIKENSSAKTATAWMDKKGTDEIHKQLAKESTLNKHFKKIEIDNDVAPAEFKIFEEDFENVYKKLPAIPKDRMPVLRVRKLGRHNASGVYFPSKNTLCVDVRDSSSMIHELGHYYDFSVKNNQSLSKEFREIVSEYSDGLSFAKTPGGKDRDYYTTPTEVHSRFFEVYASEKLGIDNRLVNKDRFNNFDYKPIVENENLKKKAFAFFEKTFENNNN